MKLKLPKPRIAIVRSFIILAAALGIAGTVSVPSSIAGYTYGFIAPFTLEDGWDCYPWSGVTGGVPFGSCNASTVGGFWQTTTCLSYYACGDSFDPFNCGNISVTNVQCIATGCTPDYSCAASTYVGYTCDDTCGGSVPGTKPLPTCADTGQSGVYPYCFTPSGCSVSNACGATNSGTTIDYYGTCSVSAPALPGGYGTTCTSASNSCGMTNSGTIDCSASCNAVVPPDSLCAGPQPDLTVTQPINPVTATAGTPVTFTGRIDNIGTGPASPAFKSYFLVDGATYVWTAPSITIPGSTNAAVTAGTTYNFTTAGVHTVQLCADGANVVPELHEDNNCGSPTTVNVSPAAAATITSCTPSPALAAPGQNVTWSVVTSGFVPLPTTYNFTSPGGSPASASGASVTFTTKYASGGSYSATVDATNGSQSAGPQACVPVTISGAPSTCASTATPIISSSPSRVTSGSSSTISYSATGIAVGKSCVITGNDIGGTGINTLTTSVSDSGCNITGGNVTISNITKQSTYTIDCSGTKQTTIVNITPTYREY